MKLDRKKIITIIEGGGCSKMAPIVNVKKLRVKFVLCSIAIWNFVHFIRAHLRTSDYPQLCFACAPSVTIAMNKIYKTIKTNKNNNKTLE